MPRFNRPLGDAAALLLAAVLLSLPNGSDAAGLTEGQWAGTWYPGSSCRDTKERAITAEVAAGKIKGQVENRHGRPGLFRGEVKENGNFQVNVRGLKSYSFTMFGQGGGGQVSGRWTTRNDCGAGKFTLALASAAPTAAAAAPANESPRQLLDRLLQDGLITEAEHQETLSELGGGEAAAQPTAAVPGDARVQALQELYQKGLISKADYEQKLSQLQAEKSGAAAQAAPAPDPRLQALEDLYNKGLISEEDYKRKAAEIKGASD